MAIDTSYVLSYSVLAIIEFGVFFLSLLVYKNTKGASLGYKKWAIGTFILLISSILFITAATVFECSEEVSSNKNELHKIIIGSITAIGYFYIPVGLLYFSKDLGVSNFDEDLIKKSQIIFFNAIFSIAILYIVLFPFFKILSIVGATLNSIYAFVWIFAIFEYKEPYQKILKGTNFGWTLMYIGMFAGLFSEIFNVLFFVIPEVEILQIISEIIMAFGFISAFTKIAKMVEAI